MSIYDELVCPLCSKPVKVQVEEPLIKVSLIRNNEENVEIFLSSDSSITVRLESCGDIQLKSTFESIQINPGDRLRLFTS